MPIVAVLYAALLTVFAGRYGYHRDELYFVAAGRHLDWGYADQPALTPLIARIMTAIDPDSLLLLRVPAIVAGTVIVVCAGLMAREFGGGRAAQALAAGVVASAAMVLGAGHMLSTAVFDMALWSVLWVLVLRLLREPDAASGGPESASRLWRPGDPRWWLAIGLVIGIGLENKLLLIFPVGALVAALLLVGPRKVFANRYFPMAIGIALVLWVPYLWWQADNGWPQWDLSREIAAGGSGTSDSPIEFVVLQFGLMGPLLVPLWVYGWWRIWKSVRYRAFAVSYVLLFVVFLVTGGKAYYLGGLYPVLLAAAAVPFAGWLGQRRIRWAAVGSVVAVNAAVGAVLFLPVLPVSALNDSPVLAVNYDAGENLGWPELARRVGEIRAGLGPEIAIFTDNYGEAGAIERYGAPYDLPRPQSGHNAYWWWGPPSDTATAVITIGMDRTYLERFFTDIQSAGQFDNGLDIDNDEQGEPLFVCRGPRAPWAEMWPGAKHLG